MYNNKLIKIYCLIIVLLFATSNYAGAQNEKLKQFSVKVYGGYSITNETSKLQLVGGNLSISNAPVVGAAFGWHYNKNWSAAIAAIAGNYKIDMVNGDYKQANMYRYNMSLGNVWMVPISLSFRYHLPVWANLVPYASAGGTYTLFTNPNAGWGADGVVYKSRPAFHLGLGTDYFFTKNWFVNAELCNFFTDRSNVDIDFRKSTEYQIKAQLQPNPINCTIGIGYRF